MTTTGLTVSITMHCNCITCNKPVDSVVLRAEWAKSRARAERWEEEVLILKTEMIRTIRFLHRKARWWRTQASLRVEVREEVRRGLIAYGEKQAKLREELARSFASQWLACFATYAEPIPRLWPSGYRYVTPAHSHVVPRRHRTLAVRTYHKTAQGTVFDLRPLDNSTRRGGKKTAIGRQGIYPLFEFPSSDVDHR